MREKLDYLLDQLKFRHDFVEIAEPSEKIDQFLGFNAATVMPKALILYPRNFEEDESIFEYILPHEFLHYHLNMSKGYWFYLDDPNYEEDPKILYIHSTSQYFTIDKMLIDFGMEDTVIAWHKKKYENLQVYKDDDFTFESELEELRAALALIEADMWLDHDVRSDLGPVFREKGTGIADKILDFPLAEYGESIYTAEGAKVFHSILSFEYLMI